MLSKEQQLVSQLRNTQNAIKKALALELDAIDFLEEYSRFKTMLDKHEHFEFNFDFYNVSAELVKSITQLRHFHHPKKKDFTHLNNLIGLLKVVAHKHPLLKKSSFTSAKNLKRISHDLDYYALYVKEIVAAADKACV